MTSKTMAGPKQDHGKTRASAWQDQSKCMARPHQVHGNHTARKKQTHGNIMTARSMPYHVKAMAMALQIHGNRWQYHGNTMARPEQYQIKTIAIAWQDQSKTHRNAQTHT
jgi:hypothetical protein